MPDGSEFQTAGAETLQETRMLSQALNRAMPHSRNQLEGVNRKELIFLELSNH